MGALDQKFDLAVTALRVEAKRRGIPFKEMMVRITSDCGYLTIPLWNEEFDARLVARSEAARAKAVCDG